MKYFKGERGKEFLEYFLLESNHQSVIVYLTYYYRQSYLLQVLQEFTAISYGAKTCKSRPPSCNFLRHQDTYMRYIQNFPSTSQAKYIHNQMLNHFLKIYSSSDLHLRKQRHKWLKKKKKKKNQNHFRRRQWHPTPVLLLGKSHGWRSLVGCSP